MLGAGIFDGVVSLIEAWPSGSHRSERPYREGLYEYLLRNVHHHSVRKEAGSSRADIGIGDRVAIELKFNFASRGQVRDLFSQVALHQNSFSEGVVCVLCGNTDRGAVAEFRTLIRTKLSRGLGYFYPEDRIHLVYKS